jgi:hypothetical protein
VGVGPAATLLPYLLPIVLRATPFVAGRTLPPTTVELPVFALLIVFCARACRVSKAGHVHDASMREWEHRAGERTKPQRTTVDHH